MLTFRYRKDIVFNTSFQRKYCHPYLARETPRDQHVLLGVAQEVLMRSEVTAIRQVSMPYRTLSERTPVSGLIESHECQVRRRFHGDVARA